MSKHITLGSPTKDLGDNQFLTHLTHEIVLNDRPIGHILVSVYNWGQAEEMATARAWLTKDNTYLGRLKRYLFDPDYQTCQLPEMVGQGIVGPTKALIIDDIVLNPSFMELGIEIRASYLAIQAYEEECSFVLFPGWAAMACRMGIPVHDQIECFANIGLNPMDDFAMIRYLDDEFLNSLIIVPM